MGNVIPFPGVRPAPKAGGIIHVWRGDLGIYEVGHESSSGNSWGSFSQWHDARQAVDAAHRLNDEYGGDCEVHVSRAVLRDLNPGRREVEF